MIQRSLEKQARAGKIGADEAAAVVGRIETAVSLEVRVGRRREMSRTGWGEWQMLTV